PQWTLLAHPRILLPQRAGGGVSRIRERRLARIDQSRVELRELPLTEEHLATDLNQLRHRELVGGREPLGDITDGPYVQGDVLAGAAVTAGQRAGQPTVLVQQVDREPVAPRSDERRVGT